MSIFKGSKYAPPNKSTFGTTASNVKMLGKDKKYEGNLNREQNKLPKFKASCMSCGRGK